MNEALLLERNYRSFLRQSIEEQMKVDADLSFSKIAAECKIQRTYLSQVMNLKNHLHNDQLYAITQMMKFPRSIIQHLILLSEWERCKLELRKSELERRLRSREESIRGQGAGMHPDRLNALDDYYCDPLGEAVLKFLTMEAYRGNPARIQERLGIGPRRWQELLSTLETCGFICRKHDGIELGASPALPLEQSPADILRHIQGRLKVADRKFKQRDVDDFVYNWMFLANSERKKELKIKYLHLIQDIYRGSLQTSHENVYQLSIDLFSP